MEVEVSEVKSTLIGSDRLDCNLMSVINVSPGDRPVTEFNACLQDVSMHVARKALPLLIEFGDNISGDHQNDITIGLLHAWHPLLIAMGDTDDEVFEVVHAGAGPLKEGEKVSLPPEVQRSWKSS